MFYAHVPFVVGLDYVKDRWAFQKEDGSEHKEHTSMRAFKRYCHEIFVLVFFFSAMITVFVYFEFFS
jgi:hypothetical protein